jgi:hypothetical protein
MQKIGRLKILNGESSLAGTLLARGGTPNPLGAATDFLTNLGLQRGQCIEVSGQFGPVGDLTAFFISAAVGVNDAACLGTLSELTANATPVADLVTPSASLRVTKSKSVQGASKPPKSDGPRTSKAGKQTGKSRKDSKRKPRKK